MTAHKHACTASIEPIAIVIGSNYTPYDSSDHRVESHQQRHAHEALGQDGNTERATEEPVTVHQYSAVAETTVIDVDPTIFDGQLEDAAIPQRRRLDGILMMFVKSRLDAARARSSS